ncbi:purine-cytosine permease family protein [Saccharolobus caldissimus]|uniref:Purine-cytosine permease n=1 Tax=Saccharolobus caldissimus TaxID=1702097 RepID=A0AAQ4CS75_9CREN|nr:hypothetical protein [Saccharolobus caldissimus]BDB98656.1 hypothetical protein SACC_16730 [Saccharolobus caldissimus]
MVEESKDTINKRKYNKIVNNPVMEDYALRYAPKTFRKWSEGTVGIAALGGIAYLADFAIGGSLIVSYGFSNAFYGILIAGLIIFLTGIPIAYYAAKYNVDMDLLTRGAGFGYLGSTITSIIYASFTFIYFSLEGSVMAQAISLYFNIPIRIAYLISALVIIPLVIYGITFLSKFQLYTQPLWFILMFAPLVIILNKSPHSLVTWVNFGGEAGSPVFNPLYTGLAAGVVLSLIAQIGEQVDYLRFMPEKRKQNSKKWIFWVMIAGPGWVILGVIKELYGSFLAANVASQVGFEKATEPIYQLLFAFDNVFNIGFIALTIATLVIVLSQLKINVTNAYSGSLSWSNFFSRTLHIHPGRVIWLFLNVAIGLTLMELGVFYILNEILGFYSNVAIAWIGAITSDLVINKKILKISPDFIEFKRGHLYNINPVGFIPMILASIISIMAFFNIFGPIAQAFSPFISLTIAFALTPLIAILTKGKYYIARTSNINSLREKCVLCRYEYEKEDLLYCPFYNGTVCSLCCTLEKQCHEICKKGSIHFNQSLRIKINNRSEKL